MCEGRRGEKEGETEGGGRPETNRVRGHCTGSWLARGGLPGTVPAATAGWGGAGSAGAHTGVPPAGWAGAAGTASPVGSAGRAGHVGWAGSPKKAGNSEIPDEHCPAVDTWHRERAPGFRPSSANWPGDAGGSHCPSLQGQRECPLIVTGAFQTHKGEGARTSVRGASVHLLAALPKPRGHLGTSTSSPLISNMSQVQSSKRTCPLSLLTQLRTYRRHPRPTLRWHLDHRSLQPGHSTSTRPLQHNYHSF